MRIDLAELGALIAELNDGCLKQTESEPISIRPFRAMLDGDRQAVELFGVPIWNSEDDERIFDDHDEPERLRHFVIREARDLIKSVKALEL